MRIPEEILEIGAEGLFYALPQDDELRRTLATLVLHPVILTIIDKIKDSTSTIYNGYDYRIAIDELMEWLGDV